MTINRCQPTNYLHVGMIRQSLSSNYHNNTPHRNEWKYGSSSQRKRNYEKEETKKSEYFMTENTISEFFLSQDRFNNTIEMTEERAWELEDKLI